MKSLPIASLVLVLALSGCSSSPSIQESKVKSEKEIAIENVCLNIDSSGGINLAGLEDALSELVRLDSGYMPLLQEITEWFSVSREFTGMPKKYPDFQIIKSFCRSVK